MVAHERERTLVELMDSIKEQRKSTSAAVSAEL